MQLKLTWRIKDRPDINLLVPAEQKIAETIQILAERGFIEDEAADMAEYVKSIRTSNQVDILLTYNEANIYSGDILELIDNSED